MKNKWQIDKAGFSLVEITLALMVISVGLLAVFGLPGDSLRANTKTLDDTIAASFAESVLDSVFASEWTARDYPILMGASDFWDSGDSSSRIELCRNENDIKTHKYLYGGIDYYALRYNLLIVEQTRWQAGGLQPITSSAPRPDTIWRALRLRVWIGEFADTNDENAYEFYTEQYNFVDPKKEYEGG